MTFTLGRGNDIVSYLVHLINCMRNYKRYYMNSSMDQVLLLIYQHTPHHAQDTFFNH